SEEASMLYPKSNKYRDLYNLNGIWKFKTVSDDYIPEKEALDASFMAVPASYNDIVTSKETRDYVGKVLYETTFSIPVRDEKIYHLRIGGASHKCDVYLNGKLVAHGINGFFPIDTELFDLEEKNRLSVVIDNRLTFQTLPVGRIVNGKQVINHDFYNFTGIHRDVLVYSTPKKYIHDIEIKTVVDGDYSKISVITDAENALYTVFDKLGNVVIASRENTFNIENPILWDTENPYLYTLCIETDTDKYEEKFGIRKVEATGDALLLNDRPVYLKGFGMHEDSFILGKGNSPAVNIRNFELLKWIGANSIRTSHYPYSEEIMSLADEYGIMVIDEVPAVGMGWWDPTFSDDRANDETKELHKELIRQLMARDKNHPSVIMLSVANEAATHEERAREYFADVIDTARKTTSLPITIIEFSTADVSLVGDLVDVIGINRYYGWYYEHGDTSVIREQMITEIGKWRKKCGKPVFVAEFGADTIEGLHSLPSESFSEEFQIEYVRENCEAFDSVEGCIGEHVWNFADFKTKQGLTRIRGNRKGVFTKDRQPKLVAHFLRERWAKK
ncbi:MAG: beta-glucuronidase, partial [Clostridia bacterium]|nr:beta-glucuronidase [Clostridia bacterium]